MVLEKNLAGFKSSLSFGPLGCISERICRRGAFLVINKDDLARQIDELEDFISLIDEKKSPVSYLWALMKLEWLRRKTTDKNVNEKAMK